MFTALLIGSVACSAFAQGAIIVMPTIVAESSHPIQVEPSLGGYEIRESIDRAMVSGAEM